MRPKDYIEDITTLTNTLTESMTYSQDTELDEYVDFISEFLTEFRNEKVYVTPLPCLVIQHPEGLRRHLIDTPHNLVDTPTDRTVVSEFHFMGSFETLKHSVIRELNLNKEVFIYNILPYRHMDSDGEIRYEPVMRWTRLPLEMWYNDVPPTDPINIIKMIKKHKL
mgnify:CR=1 FL=1|tara:strand:+ start:89699 stop:90196 length:498 start_codon:yes stop_codon:yes gene_type:complete